MTAPGPQQPDEVRVLCWPCQYDICNRCSGFCDCTHPTARPAAPSAQPDEIERDDLAHLDTRQLHEWTEQTSTPAQPVRAEEH